MTRNNKIFLALTIGGTSLAYLIYRKIKKDSLFDELLNKIGQGTTFSESNIWNSSFMILIDNENRNIKKLTPQELNRYAELMHEAVDGWGTNEGELKSVFEQISSKYEIAQLNKYYGQKYGETMKEAVDYDLEDDPETRTEVNNLILSKPRVIYL
tara:strand:+ start:799 stop:1263 length:465 start_codon:yes stop_codon:yes gene_type:complete